MQIKISEEISLDLATYQELIKIAEKEERDLQAQVSVIIKEYIKHNRIVEYKTIKIW